MSHKVSYKWFRKTQVIPEYVVFYKNMGGFRKYSLVILDVSETLFSDWWGFRIYGDFAEILK